MAPADIIRIISRTGWAPADIIRIISRTGCEDQAKNYVKGQGEEYHRLYRGQLKMFE